MSHLDLCAYKDNLFIFNLLVLETNLLILCFIFVLLHPKKNKMNINQNYIEAVKKHKGCYFTQSVPCCRISE